MADNVSVPFNNFEQSTPANADEVDANFGAVVDWINDNAVHLDGSKPFTSVPSGPATDPTLANHLVRKSWVDDELDDVATAYAAAITAAIAAPNAAAAAAQATADAAAPGYVAYTADTSGAIGTSGVAGTATLLSQGVTLSTTHRYKITVNYPPLASTDTTTILSLKRGGVILNKITLADAGACFVTVDGPSLAGSFTYTVDLTTIAAGGASITTATNRPLFMLVEDMGT